MRITNKMMTNTMIRNIQNNLERMNKKQNEISTGKKVTKPSDDPVAVSKILKYKSKQRELIQYKRNAKDALSFTSTTELAIDDTVNALGRVRDLLVKASNDTYSDTDKKTMMDEIKQLKKHIINNANKTFNGKHLFSAFKTNKKLLNDDGNFNIDITGAELNNKSITTYEVGVGEEININTNGLNLFGASLVDDFFNDNMNVLNKIGGNRATKATINAKGFNNYEDYSGKKIEIDLNGDFFSVNLSSLDGSSVSIKNKDLLNVIKETIGSSGDKFSDKADIFMNAKNELTIQSKELGGSQNIELLSSSDNIFTSPILGTNNLGEDIKEASIATELAFTDSEINNSNDAKEMIVNYFNETKKISIDMSSLSNIGDLQNEISNQLNSAFSDKISELNTIKSGANYSISVTGNPIEISTSGSENEGPIPELNMELIQSRKPQLMVDLDKIIFDLENNNKDEISNQLDVIDKHLDIFNSSRSDIGARTNRLNMIINRIDSDHYNLTELLSEQEDADIAKSVMEYKSAEMTYNASLSAGSKIIQPTLIDYLR